MKMRRSQSQTKAMANLSTSKGMTVRKDGLRVFLDGDKRLDWIRLNEPDARIVIVSVALRRLQQTAMSYARKHAPRLQPGIANMVRGFQILLPHIKEVRHV